MSRALYRGLSTPERIRYQLPVEEPGSPTKDREEQENERPRSRPIWETCFPHCMRLWIKQNVSYSSHKSVLKSSDTGSKSAKGSDSPGSLSMNSSITSSGSGCGPDCFSSLSCYRKPLSLPFLPVCLLCLIGAFLLLSLTGSSRSIQRVVFPPHNYRRAQLLAWREVLRGGILGRGSMLSDPREVATCPNGMEDYIPCFNVTGNLEAGYKDGREFDPHCEVTSDWRCLIAPPKDYRLVLKWPDSREGIWRGNVYFDEATVENRFVVEENMLRFPAKDQELMDEIGSYAEQITRLLELSGVEDLTKAGIRSILDIGCGMGNLGAYLSGHDLVTMCIGPYEEHGGQVQISLERGLPAMVGSLTTTQLPYPSSSYDLIHCAKCGIERHLKDTMSLIEIDRVLRIGGFFVWMIPVRDGSAIHNEEVLMDMTNLTSSLGWKMVSPFQHNSIMVWQKREPYIKSLTQNGGPTLCEQGKFDADWPWHQSLRPCITSPPVNRRVSVQEQQIWPLRLQIATIDAANAGPTHDGVATEPNVLAGTVAEYWSLLTPAIFSDHPRRLGDEDKQPANLVRNVMDLNAGYGAFNSALILSEKLVWVMNIIPTSALNTLPFIFDRGLVGAVHDWCEPFPTYPRSYDLLHASDLLSQELRWQKSCGLANLFLEMDRILRPEGWVIFRDEASLIEDARSATNQMRWDSRVVEVTGNTEQRLLVCQKMFWKA